MRRRRLHRRRLQRSRRTSLSSLRSSPALSLSSSSSSPPGPYSFSFLQFQFFPQLNFSIWKINLEILESKGRENWVFWVAALRYKERRWDSKRMLDSGGMPSSHSATVTALAVAIGLKDGVGGPAFAISLVLACIVCRKVYLFSPFISCLVKMIPCIYILYFPGDVWCLRSETSCWSASRGNISLYELRCLKLWACFI